MNFEKPDSIDLGYERELTHEQERAKAETQRRLMVQSIKEGEKLESHMMDWIAKKSQNFGLVFDALINENPTLFADLEDPEKCLKVINTIENRMSTMPDKIVEVVEVEGHNELEEAA